MNLWQLLLLPWMAWSKRTRGLIAWATLVIVGIAVIGHALSHRPDVGHLGLTHALAIIDCVLWGFVLPRSLLLANDAHRLRLPTLARAAATSTVLYAMLTVALPTAVLALLGGNGVVALTELALGAGIGMGYATLPYWLGFWACLTPTLDNHAGGWLPMPGSDPGGFVHWAAPAAVVLWLAVAWCWRYAVRSTGEASRWRTSTVLRWRTFAAMGRSGARMEAELLRRRAGWLQPGIDLRGTGPGRLVGSLRVALGGWGMLQTTRSRLRQAGRLSLSLLFMLALIALLRYTSHDTLRDAAYATVLSMLTSLPAIAFALALFGIVLGPVQAEALRTRWSRDNAELAVLALLPGFVDAAGARRALLAAGLLPTLLVQAALLAGALGSAWWAHLPAINLGLLLLAQGAGLLATVALSVAALGGTMLRRLWQSVLTIAATVLMLTTAGAALLAFGNNAFAPYLVASPTFFALWAALLVTLLAIGRRGWHAFQHRPHPFLPNAL